MKYVIFCVLLSTSIVAEYCFEGAITCKALSIKETISFKFQDKARFCCTLQDYLIEIFLKKDTDADMFEIDLFLDYALCNPRIHTGLNEHVSISYQTIKDGNYPAISFEGTIYIPQKIIQEYIFFFPIFSTILPLDTLLSHLVREYYENNIISILYFSGCFGF